jgi:hypothetical protein
MVSTEMLAQRLEKLEKESKDRKSQERKIPLAVYQLNGKKKFVRKIVRQYMRARQHLFGVADIPYRPNENKSVRSVWHNHDVEQMNMLVDVETAINALATQTGRVTPQGLKKRDAFILHELEGLGFPSIARIQRSSTNEVRRNWEQCVEELWQHLEDYDPERILRKRAIFQQFQNAVLPGAHNGSR